MRISTRAAALLDQGANVPIALTRGAAKLGSAASHCLFESFKGICQCVAAALCWPRRARPRCYAKQSANQWLRSSLRKGCAMPGFRFLAGRAFASFRFRLAALRFRFSLSNALSSFGVSFLTSPIQ